MDVLLLGVLSAALLGALDVAIRTDQPSKLASKVARVRLRRRPRFTSARPVGERRRGPVRGT